MFRAPKTGSTPDVQPSGAEPSNETDIAATRPPVVDSVAYAHWEAVHTDNVRCLHRLIYARVGNRPDAEDLTSEVFRTPL